MIRWYLAAIWMLSLSSMAIAQNDSAQSRYERGAALYKAEKFAEAANELARAYALDPSDKIVFAYAQAARKSGDCETAVKLYRELLERSESESQSASIERVIAECEATAQPLDDPAAPPPLPTEPEPDTGPKTAAINETLDIESAQPSVTLVQPTRSRRRSRVLPAITAAVGVVGLGVGTTYLVMSRSDVDSANQAATLPRYKLLRDRAETRQNYAAVGFVAGGVLAVAGTVWFFASGSGSSASSESGSARTTAAAPWVSPSAAGLSITGSF